MANEATINIGLQIRNLPLDYRSHPTDFRADVTGKKGPGPGAFQVTTEGVDVDLSEFTTPGLCRVMNLDDTNFVEYGIFDGLEFIPLGEILAEEFYILRLSRNLTNSFGTGTGTIDSGNTFRIKADTAACNVVVEAFEA